MKPPTNSANVSLPSEPQVSASTSAADSTSPTTSEISFGTRIESIAAALRVDHADVALVITSVLSGIAGPYAGFVMPTGHRVRCGLNLVGTDPSNAKAAMLEDMLLHPLRTRTRFLRARASGMSRTLADQWAFGRHMAPMVEPSPLPWVRERGHKQSSIQEGLFKSAYLPPDNFDEMELMSPLYYPGRDAVNVETAIGPEHLPSVMFEGLTCQDILPALRESLHREILLCHPEAGIFGNVSSGNSKDGAQAKELAGLLRGKDVSFPKVHSDQGHGTFELARVHLWASSSLVQLGTALNSTSGWNDVLKTCLLWNPSPSTKVATAADPSSSIRHYAQVVHHLLETRCFGRINNQVRLGLQPKAAAKYPDWRTNYDKIFAQVPEQDREHTVQFHDLPERLMWMFMQFRQEDEQPWSAMAAAFHTAKHAVKKHVQLLHQARAKHGEVETLAALETVKGILRRKGPCKLRDLQRSTNNIPVARLRPGLELLRQRGLVVVDDENRYSLIPTGN